MMQHISDPKHAITDTHILPKFGKDPCSRLRKIIIIRILLPEKRAVKMLSYYNCPILLKFGTLMHYGCAEAVK